MNEDKNLNDLFKSFEGQWDTHEPEAGHQRRFLDRLNEKKKKKSLPLTLVLPIAAAILILFGIFTIYSPNVTTGSEMAKVSPDVQETQMYFTSVIEKELAKVENEKSPETAMLVRDALNQMRVLEKDYDKLTKELMEKGESKQLIHAMIKNLQTRISFLEEVLTRIENIKKLKENYNENATI